MKKLTKDVSSITKSLSGVGKSLTKNLTVPLLALGGLMVKVGAEFEGSMSKLGAVTGATGKDFDALSDKAMEMGADTKYSAKEAADAMTELAKAGMNTQETIAAIPGVLSMAATENMELADAAVIVSAALNSYSMEAEDAVKVSDILAKNSNMSASGVTSLGEALAPVSGFASEVGVEFETLNAMLGILSNNGLDGAIAGQKLSAILRTMSAPTKKARDAAEELGLSFFDAEGTMKPFPQIIDDINKATEGMGDQQKMTAIKTMFGADAIAAMLPLLRTGGTEIQAYSDSLKDSAGYADMTAAAMNDNLIGALDQLSASLETAGIAMYKNIGPSLKSIVQALTKLVGAFAGLSPEAHKLIMVFGFVAAAIGPVMVMAAGLAKVWGNVKAAMAIASKAKNVGAVLTALAGGPMGVIFLALMALVAAIIFMVAYWDEVVIVAKKVGSAFMQLGSWIKGIGIAFLGLMGIASGDVTAGFDKLKEKMSGLGPVFDTIKSKMGALGGAIGAGWSMIATTTVSAFSGIISSVAGFFGSISSGTQTTFSGMGSMIGGFFGTVVSSISEAFSGLSGVFGFVSQIIGTYVEKIIGQVRSLIEGFKTLISTGDFSPLINAVAALFPMLLGLFIGGTPGLIYAGIRLIGAIADGMGLSTPQLIEQVTNTIVSAIDSFSAALPGFIEVGTGMLLSLIDGIVLALPGIIEAITAVITTITDALVILLPILIETGMGILLSLITGILSMLPSLLMVVVQIITALVTAFISLLPMILEIGITLLMGIIQGIVTLLPMLLTTAVTLITTLISGIISVLPALISAGMTLITTLINVIISLIPTIISAGTNILMSLISGIISVLPALIGAIVSLMGSLLSTLLQALPALISAGVQILMALINGIVQIIPVLISTALQLIFAIVKSLIGALPQILAAGVKILMALIRGIIQIVPALISAILQLVVGILKALLSAVPKVLSAGVKMIQALVRGVLSVIGAVMGAAGKIGTSILDKLKSINLVDVGSNLIKGLWNGISNMAGWISGKIGGFASGVTDSLKDFFGIHSPSRLWRDEIGKMLPQGMVVGMEMEENNIAKASKSLVEMAMPKVDDSTIPISVQSANATLGNDNKQTEDQKTQGDIYVTIERFENNTDTDVERIAHDLAWMTSRERGRLSNA